jgi:hypothetical protein
MPRTYSVRTAALTVGTSDKWIDNVLSHHAVAGVRQGTRGVERQLDDVSLLVLAICRLLSQELGIPISSAVSVANEVVATRSSTNGHHAVGSELSLRFSLEDIERKLRARLADAVESVAHIRRGRPPLHARQG